MSRGEDQNKPKENTQRDLSVKQALNLKIPAELLY